MDKSLGDLMDHLDSIGQAENTLLIFLGDNGSDAPMGDKAKPTPPRLPTEVRKEWNLRGHARSGHNIMG